MVKLLILVRQKQNLKQDLIIIKVRTGHLEKNVKYDSNVFSSDDWQFTSIEQCETHDQLKERETFWQHRLKTFYPYGINKRKEYLY